MRYEDLIEAFEGEITTLSIADLKELKGLTTLFDNANLDQKEKVDREVEVRKAEEQKDKEKRMGMIGATGRLSWEDKEEGKGKEKTHMVGYDYWNAPYGEFI